MADRSPIRAAAAREPLPALAADSDLRSLLAVHSVARALTSSLDRDSILRAIMEQMQQFFQPENWSLLLVDDERRDLYYAVAAGTIDPGLRVPMGRGLAGWVAEHGESLIVPEVNRDERFDARLAFSAEQTGAARRPRIRSAVCMPLRLRERTLGVIQLFNCDLASLTDSTIAFLHVLSDYAAIAIDNARAVERIHELTITDDCTGLYNVRHLYEKLEESVTPDGPPFSLIFIDLDHFKLVNYAHGHLVGSALLREVGQALRYGLRSGDLVFRYGGDEFIILLPGTGKSAAARAAARVLESLRARRFSGGLALEVRASFGVATWPEDGASVHEIIRAADGAMYRVKDTTRDSIAVSGPDAPGSPENSSTLTPLTAASQPETPSVSSK